MIERLRSAFSDSLLGYAVPTERCSVSLWIRSGIWNLKFEITKRSAVYLNFELETDSEPGTRNPELD
ncbi:MAG: hypothetical protein DWQ47_03880 [Acidobacteria bacterium]|nr:MAG: hypothetical protein DWQ32_07430 [Acidobacteriota bacterium]REK01534.1 MAG: hypothetical protein DWQ38_03865 [Acidobacteriota bacterium]REK14490.1 MAG: hypothetical protein DWQ43_13120 [Acidobacteriota bacterium]REK45205.1 MAG: hypothetical protein DWQ47_03880 [Acidobacteriota bacterium]